MIQPNRRYRNDRKAVGVDQERVFVGAMDRAAVFDDPQPASGKLAYHAVIEQDDAIRNVFLLSDLEEAIARYSGAERQLCDEARPLLGAIIRGVEAPCGLRISELRVTIDWANSINGEISANCTIVQAEEPDGPAPTKTSNGAGDPART